VRGYYAAPNGKSIYAGDGLAPLCWDLSTKKANALASPPRLFYAHGAIRAISEPRK